MNASKYIVVWINNRGCEVRSVPMGEKDAAEFSRRLKRDWGINVWVWLPA